MAYKDMPVFKSAVEENRLSEEAIDNAIRIAKEMFERGEDEEEILDTLSKTFEAKMDELREMVRIAEKKAERR